MERCQKLLDLGVELGHINGVNVQEHIWGAHSRKLCDTLNDEAKPTTI
jgi:hypothetical protein